MVGRDDQRQFIFVQHHPVQSRLARRQVADADVQGAIEQSSLDFQPGQFIDLHHQMGLRLAHPLKHLWHQAGVHGLQYANGQGAQCVPLEIAQCFPCPLQAVEQGQGMVVQRMGGQGGQQAFTAAFEQAHIEVLFQLADLL
ncbi:hypothetical protein D3C84_145140 [compost metagenome]